MSRADHLVEKGADALRDLARAAAAQGPPVSRLAEPLADDASFLRKLKPTLIARRVRGEPTPTADQSTPVAAPPVREDRVAIDPFVALAGALAAGVVTARILDWRGHAHPR